MEKELDKYALKEQIYHIYDEMNKLTGALMNPACADDETGMLRSKVYNELARAAEHIKEVAYHIY